MPVEPLQKLGLWRAWESARESAIPILVATAAWTVASSHLRAAAAGRPLSDVEQAVTLGALAALTSWAVARQWTVFGVMRPWPPMVWGTLLALGAVGLSGPLTTVGFSGWCTDTLSGAIVELAGIDGRGGGTACQVGAVPGNAYLKGTLVYPNWSGTMGWQVWLFVAVSAMLSAIGLRDLRLWPTAVARQLEDLLRLAPAAGLDAVAGPPKATEGKVVACRNATLWGELCGQLYAAERVFAPGEWCVRCQQPFRPAERQLKVTIVSLATAELDVLNGLERLDMLTWHQGERPPPDPRISGQERWVVLGELTLPDVITVSQSLALVMPAIAGEAGNKDVRRAEAARLAMDRASRVACWFWNGRPLDRLTYARPTPSAVLGVGAERLRDLLPESGEQIVLQLEIGLLPIELRTGFRKRFLDPSRGDAVRNSKQDVWVPVGPLGPIREAPGAWVPRVEGDALRTWLSLDRARPDTVRGVTVPLAYVLPERSSTVTLGAAKHPSQGFDLVRMRPRAEDGEPDNQRRPGDSISEWDWLEPEQIALLRQEVLVLVDPREHAP